MKNALTRDDSYETIKLVKTTDEMRRLNLNEISILKVDTEGCEVQIVQEILSAVARVDFVYLEYHSDEDRRELDRLLSNFLLIWSSARGPYWGTCTYAAKSLIQRHPDVERMSIRPQPAG